MAIAFGGSVGTPVNDTENAASTIALTSVAIPSNSFITMFVSWYAASGTASMGGGGLSWGAADSTQTGTADVNRHIAIIPAQAPSGVAASSTLTATVPAGSFGRAIFGIYFTGIATSSPKDVSTGAAGTTAVWNSGAASTTVADEVIVGACWFDGLVGTNNPDGTDTEPAGLDFNNALNASWVAEYRIVSATGSYGIGGTWSGGTTPEWLAAMATYKADTGGASVPGVPTQVFNPIPFMGGH